jgi:hypothetical protein
MIGLAAQELQVELGDRAALAVAVLHVSRP